MRIISKDEIKNIAKLAELYLTNEEIDIISLQLEKILAHFIKINQADTSKIRPTSHILEIRNVFREDIAKSSMSKEEALKNAPKKIGNGFMVPKID